MRKLLFPFLFLFALSAFSQDFKFDLLAKYNSERDGFKRSSIWYANSDGTCAMKLFLEGSKTIAQVYELNTRVIHRFEVLEGSEGRKFVYVDTDSTKINLKLPLTHEIEFTKMDSDKKVLTQKTFRVSDSGKKREVAKTIMKLAQNEKSLYFLFRLSCMENPFGINGEETSETGLVESAEERNRSGTRFIKLEYCKPVNVKVSLPANLVNKKV